MSKKVIHLGGGPAGTVQIASWKCNFGIYLDIQAITTLLCLLYICIFLPYNCSPEKWHFLAFKNLCSQQFSTYRHQTGFNVKRKQVRITNYLGIPINWYFFFLISKVSYFAPQNYTDFKKFNIHFFSQKDNWAYVVMQSKKNTSFKKQNKTIFFF